MRKLLSIIIAALFFAIPAFATDINVVVSGAFTAAYTDLIPKYEHETHNKIVTGYGPSMGKTVNAIPVRLARGESIDVVIMASPGLDPLMKAGQIHKDSRVELVRSLIGMAVKTGAPHPDISTLDAFKHTLLSAKSIAFSDSASGVYLRTYCSRNSESGIRSNRSRSRSRPILSAESSPRDRLKSDSSRSANCVP
jgi:molybdate transport system substrate-binding protein